MTENLLNWDDYSELKPIKKPSTPLTIEPEKMAQQNWRR